MLFVTDCAALLLKRMVGVHAPVELVFPHDALATIRLTFDAVLGRASRFREQTNDLEEIASGVLLALIRPKADRLANSELVRCHRTSQHLAL
jgi:hypothetical protein